MNIVIPLGTGSKHNDNELRYCLRGIELHLKGWEKLILVGRRPEWLRDDQALVFIPATDKPGGKYKEWNISNKIRAAINSGHAGDDFLFMNDDHFFLKDVQAAAFPYHYKEPLAVSFKRLGHYSTYRRTLWNTMKAVPAGAMNYDTHCPIVYNSETFLRVIPAEFPPYGYAIKTLYSNRAGIKGEQYDDCKITWPVDDYAQHYDLLMGRPYFSIGDGGCCEQMWKFLSILYIRGIDGSVPSRFEAL